MEDNDNIDLIKEQCHYQEYIISELQGLIARADTKVSILLAAIGVFLKIAIDAYAKAGSCFLTRLLLILSVIFSAASVIIGVIILWRRGSAMEDRSYGKTNNELLNKLTNQVDSLKTIYDDKFKHLNKALVCFAISAILTMILVLIG